MGRYSRSPSRSRSRDRGGGGGGGGGGGDSEDDGCRVHVADLGVDCSQREIEKAFGKFGDIKEVWLARNPPCFAFVVFQRRQEAEEAIREMDGRVVCGSRIRCTWARPRTRGRPPPSSRSDGSFKCYQCGEKGHFSRDCRNGRNGGGGYRSGGGGGRGGGGGGRRYEDDYRRPRNSRRSRSRSRSRGRNNRRSSYSRSRSRSISRGYRANEIDNGIRGGAY